MSRVVYRNVHARAYMCLHIDTQVEYRDTISIDVDVAI